MARKRVLIFIDNEAASRASWIAGRADSAYANRMIHLGASFEAELEVMPYFCRVPTFSNLGDGPSRMDFDACLALGARRWAVESDVLVRCAGLEDVGGKPLLNPEKG